MADVETGMELRDVDIPDVIEELGQPFTLIKFTNPTEENPTGELKIEVNGCFIDYTNRYQIPLNSDSKDTIIIDVSKIQDNMPELSDIIEDIERNQYRITKISNYWFAGIKVASELTVEI